MPSTIRLTMAQALVRAMTAQKTVYKGETLPLFAGVWAIFGHGNVAALGEALYGERDRLPTYRAHHEQAMAHAAIAFAKASRRRRMMAATSSIGPGATNMVTAAALAHVNRLPVLLLPGDVFAGRAPDPVLQQIENFADGAVSANDCFRPVSNYFDRITRPEQIMPAFERALHTLTDPVLCGPVTLALCQDVQAEAFDYPIGFFRERLWEPRRPEPDRTELARAAALLKSARKPMVICGGGVLYSEAEAELRAFCEALGAPAAETQAGKSAIPDDHPLMMGALGVTGTAAANQMAEEADVILSVGSRLQDFTTGSHTLFKNATLIGLNVVSSDAIKLGATSLVADARTGLAALREALAGHRAPSAWTDLGLRRKTGWRAQADAVLAAPAAAAATSNAAPSDAQVIGAVQRRGAATDVVVCAAGGLPGELHKLWRAQQPGGYHLEYGYSCMGYEIAGGLGVKLADPSREVIVMVGDGSYLMMNSEIATSVMLGLKLIIVVLDNRGFGCINRLQRATGSPSFNNLWRDARQETAPAIDFAAHAAALGADAVHAGSIQELEDALSSARAARRTQVIVIDTDPLISTAEGGHWWDVAVPEVSPLPGVIEARRSYESAIKARG